MAIKPLRICLDISAALAQGAGIGRYARELAIAMRGIQDGQNLTLFHNRQSLDKLPGTLDDLPRIAVPWNNKIWRIFLLSGLRLPHLLDKSIRQCDLFHGTDSIAPRIDLPTVITIHDLSTTLFPQHHTLLHRLFARISLPRMAQHASAIIADSDATRKDIEKHLHIPNERIGVIYLGVDHNLFYPRNSAESQQEVENTLHIKPPYILTVGTLEPRKNLEGFLRAYAQLPEGKPRAVLVGARGWGDSPLFSMVKELGLESTVSFTGFVPDKLLPVLYAGAEFFVYPSLYEGFGLPILEAMACGAPVITSRISSMPEVTGDAAVLIDPTNITELSRAIWAMVESKDFRTKLRQAGSERAKNFTWERTASQTIDLYKRVLGRISPA